MWERYSFMRLNRSHTSQIFDSTESKILGFPPQIVRSCQGPPPLLCQMGIFPKNASTGVPPLCETCRDEASHTAATAVISMLMIGTSSVENRVLPLDYQRRDLDSEGRLVGDAGSQSPVSPPGSSSSTPVISPPNAPASSISSPARTANRVDDAASRDECRLTI